MHHMKPINCGASLALITLTTSSVSLKEEGRKGPQFPRQICHCRAVGGHLGVELDRGVPTPIPRQSAFVAIFGI